VPPSRLRPAIACVLPLFALLAAGSLPAADRIERGPLVIEGIPDIPAPLSEGLLRYQNTRSAGLFDWNIGGRGVLIGTRFGETTQVHLVEAPGGARRQITFYNEPIAGASACPDPAARSFLFLRDIGGGENFQIYLHRMDSGLDTLMSDGKSRHTSALWSRHGDRIAYSSNRDNGRDMYLYMAGAAHPDAARAILKEAGSWAVRDWSPDDAALLVTREVSANESYLYLLDPATSTLTPIHPRPEGSKETIAYGSAQFSARGDGVYLTSDEGSEFQRLRYWDRKSGSMTDLTATLPWDVENVEVSPAGGRVAFSVNERGYSRLYLLDTATKAWTPSTGVPDGVIGGMRFDPEGARLAFSLQSSVAPSDLYVLSLPAPAKAAGAAPRAAPNGAAVRWTESEVGGLNPAEFVAPSLVEYPTFDQAGGAPRKIPAFYYRPKKGTGPFPVLINIHGGPESQYRPTFSASVQYYVNELGAAVLAPNVRGSAGYGKTWLTLDNGMKREDSVKDIGALFDWIGTQPDLDASHILIEGGSYGGYMVLAVATMGGSYGGYMSLACMTHFSDRLAAGVDVVGISSFPTFLKNTSGYRQDLRRVEYGDERDPEMIEYLTKISPLTAVDRIRKPILIVQGQNDPRVPFTESEQMLAAIKGNGVDAWYLMAKDEGHGFRKKSNVDFYSSAVALFLKTHLSKVSG
jgi:dipeptidyl aminopeptidase/acylaminoacyl peptidase